uniref:Sushi domain-containing protein n=1 Tax=Caenorhabditis tropicalis TaxID=1561998 RepID=A0A1I7UIZ5_9PELO
MFPNVCVELTVFSQSFSQGTTVTLHCDSTNYTANATCLNGEWSRSLDTCSKKAQEILGEPCLAGIPSVLGATMTYSNTRPQAL